MKVLYAFMGIPLYTHPLLEKIVSKGCDLIVLLPGNNDGTMGKGVVLSDKKNVSYRLLYSRSKKMWYGKPALVDLKKYLVQEQPDILVTVWPYFLHLFFDRSIFKIIRQNGIRLIIEEIPFQVPPFGKLNYFKKNPVYDENMECLSNGILFYARAFLTMYIRRYVYRRVSATINYASSAKLILPSYGVNSQSIFVRYNSSDTDALFSERKKIIQDSNILNKKNQILHVGRLVKWKRVDLLIEAFQKISSKYSDCELLVVGDGPERKTLERQAEGLGLSDRIFFTGAVYESYTLGKYMYESSVYVLAGMGGLSINDAMCFSLPIICSVCDGTEKDLVTDGKNGYFFVAGDTDSLAEKIDLILSDHERATKMGEESYRIVKEKINLDSVSDHYIEAFEYVLKK
jgi:glycosyltransferase involved in cell wall biosynthesis